MHRANQARSTRARATASRALAKCASKAFCPPSVANPANQVCVLRDSSPRAAQIRDPARRRVGKQPELRAHFFPSGDFQKSGPADTIHAPRHFSFRLFPPPALPLEFSLSPLNPRPAESTAQLFDDRLREFGLHREHVLQITGIIFRPEFLAGVGAGEPGSDPHCFAGFAHASVDQIAPRRVSVQFPELWRFCL